MRFDGKSFDLFGTGQGLPNRVVNEFLETRGGVKLVSIDAGLARFDPAAVPGSPHQFVPLVTKDRPAAQRTDELFEDAAGTVWAGTLGGVYRLESLRSAPYLTFIPIGPPALLVLAFADDGAGGTWLGTNCGLMRRTADGRVVGHAVGGNFPPSEPVNALLRDKQGRLWVGTYNGMWMLNLAVHQTAQVFGKRDGLASERIHSLFQSADGTIWAGTALGLAEYHKSATQSASFTTYGRAQGLHGRVVFAITETKVGTLWAATDNGVAHRTQRFPALRSL